MFNILPENLKFLIESTYHKRLIIVWLAALAVVEAIAVIFFLPSYVYLQFEDRDVQAEVTAATHTLPVSATNDPLVVITSANNDLHVLVNDIPRQTAGQVIGRAVSLAGNDVTISDIVYQRQTATTSSLMISGTAQSREGLLAFAKRLEADPTFGTVSLPVSNFAKNTNIDFTLNAQATAH